MKQRKHRVLQKFRTESDSGEVTLLEIVMSITIVTLLGAAAYILMTGTGGSSESSDVRVVVVPEEERSDSDSIFSDSDVTDEETYSTTDETAVAQDPVESAESVTPAENTDQSAVEQPVQVTERDNSVDAGTVWMMIGGIVLIIVVLAGAMLVWRLAVRNRQIADQRRYAIRQREHAREQAIEQWDRYRERFKKVQERIWEAETDWDTIFYYPAINDQSVPETREMYFAYAAAQNEQSEPPAILDGTQRISDMPYPAAVIALENAWERAWEYAASTGQSSLTVQERETIRKIMNLLKRTEDRATTDSEKHVAFDRINKLMGDLTNVTLPKRAKRELEHRRTLALEQDTNTVQVGVP